MTGKKNLMVVLFFIIGALVLCSCESLYGEKTGTENGFAEIENKVRQLMEDGDIPGLSLIIIKGDEPVYIKGFGYADMEKKVPVTPDTLFELGSCSKAFTALAALQLEERGRIELDDPVSTYFPGFYVVYEGKKHDLTIRQLLHQTSGIPTMKALSYIPVGDHDGALRQTVKNLIGIELEGAPGKQYLYSTVNYDVVGAIIEKVSGVSYEEYMVENIFKPLSLNSTIVGVNREDPPQGKATGYKIGFYSPRRYEPPVYRGNNPAGYVISNAKDVARWMRFQMGAAETPLYPLMQKTQIPDLSVKPDPQSLTSYAMGWIVNQYGNHDISHGGLNPNFTTYFYFRPGDKTAVALLANSNSTYTTFIARAVFNRLHGREFPSVFPSGSGQDKAFSVVSFMAALGLLFIVFFFILIFIDLIKGRRQFEPVTWGKTGKILGVPLALSPFLLGIYLVPRAIQDVSWDVAFVWGPKSFQTAIFLLLMAIGISYIGYIFSSLFPHKNKYLKSMPMILILSLLTGGANAVVIFLITSSLYANFNLAYMLYYFGLALVLYIGGRKVVQTKLVKITFDIVYDLRMKLIGKIFYTSYQRFERIESGRVFATLNNDTGQIGGSANLFVMLISSIITTIGVFIYLATIAFWATIVTLGVIIIIAALYYVVSQKAEKYFEAARDTQNVYMGLLRGMLDGFKELSLRFNKKLEYKSDLEASCDEFRKKLATAMIKFINAFLVGESLLIIVLGAVGFAVPRLFPDISTITLMSFIIALLYLIGPINGILGSIPGIIQIRVAWHRVQGFIKDIPANMDPGEADKPLAVERKAVQNINAKGVVFQYKPQESEISALPAGAAPGTADSIEAGIEEPMFAVGPIDFEANKGEIVFVVGGNGSGKTTLARLLTGLYATDEGEVKINGINIPNHQLGEYFSVVFGDYHLFEKLYDVDLNEKGEAAQKYLELLKMDGVVEFTDNRFSTIEVSGGQRKRLALLQCYLEDSPILLLDEVAADQDPQFRKFFYRELLAKMKEDGKIVIAITHDDHYFDVADRVIKMELGKIDIVEDGQKLSVTA